MYAAVPLAALVGWFIAESSHAYVITRSCFAAPQAVAASSPHTQQSAKALQVEEPHAALADGCRYVFLDLGGNLGMQTRKLFEPSRVAGCGGAGTHDGQRTLPELLQAYRSRVTGANAKSICYKTVFDLAFGTEAQRQRPEWGVCAFIFEPNRVHAKRLQDLQASYTKQGWRVTVFTAAIGSSDGWVKFHRDQDEQPGDNYYKEGQVPRALSGSTLADHKWGSYDVQQMDVARWVLEHVAARRVPPPPAALAGEPPSPEPFVLMKMDTEGSEHACLPQMGFTGALCAVSLAVVELHEGRAFKHPIPGLITDMRRLMENLQGCNTTLMSGDDESGGAASSALPLP